LDLISYIQPSNPQYNTLSLTTLFRSQKYSKQTQTILFTCLQGNLRYRKGNWNRNGTILRLRKSLLKTRFTNESRTVKPLKQSSKDRKSPRLNSSHVKISYAVFCLKKK